jgi:hypothetical protein
MEDFLARLYDGIVARLHGPMKFRLVIQPLVAAIFAIRAGLADARAGRPPFFWGLFTHSEQRATMLKSGFKDVAKVFTMATVMDLIYQFIIDRHVHLISALILAAVLCFIPYLVLRGPVNRLARRK